MIDRAAFQALESRETNLRANLAAGFRGVMEVIREEDSYAAVRNQMEEETDVAAVASRALSLTAQTIDPRYENPYDVALLAYLMLLREWDSELASTVAAEVVQASNLVWARQLASRIMENGKTRSEESGDSFLTFLTFETDLFQTEPNFLWEGWSGESGELVIFNALGAMQIDRTAAAFNTFLEEDTGANVPTGTGEYGTPADRRNTGSTVAPAA